MPENEVEVSRRDGKIGRIRNPWLRVPVAWLLVPFVVALVALLYAACVVWAAIGGIVRGFGESVANEHDDFGEELGHLPHSMCGWMTDTSWREPEQDT